MTDHTAYKACHLGGYHRQLNSNDPLNVRTHIIISPFQPIQMEHLSSCLHLAEVLSPLLSSGEIQSMKCEVTEKLQKVSGSKVVDTRTRDTSTEKLEEANKNKGIGMQFNVIIMV